MAFHVSWVWAVALHSVRWSECGRWGVITLSCLPEAQSLILGQGSGAPAQFCRVSFLPRFRATLSIASSEAF